jgi:chromosome segregation ATPase
MTSKHIQLNTSLGLKQFCIHYSSTESPDTCVSQHSIYRSNIFYQNFAALRHQRFHTIFSKMAPSTSKSKTTTSSHKSSSHEFHESFGSTGGLLSAAKVSDFTSPRSDSKQLKDSDVDLVKAQAALQEREAQLDEREAALKKQQETLNEREDALDAAHERLIGGEEEVEKPVDNSSSIIDELRKENEKLRAELAASKQKSGRFLSQRAEADNATNSDRFRLSERKSTSGGGLPTGFDPQMMERWRVGHQMMTPRKPRPASSRPDGE